VKANSAPYPYRPEKALEIMQDEAAKNDYDGEIRIVRFRRAG
jgi:hypothetical protein